MTSRRPSGWLRGHEIAGQRLFTGAATCVATMLVAVGVAGAQHGGPHLPPTSVNVALVGKLQLANVRSGIGDVAARKGFAYVAAWRPECPNAGTHVVDIRNPASPRKVAFVPAPAGYYVGEGVDVISPRTSSFRGDLLLTNHESCPGNDVPASGGFSLTDVTDPRRPRPLSGLVGDLRTSEGGVRSRPNSSHSVQGWASGGRAYAMLVDNIERGDDVDIFDISNPRRVRQIAEVGLVDWPSANRRPARGDNTFLHDMQVQRVGGHWLALLSYWDAGWILLNLDNPARPRLVRDHDFASTERFSGFRPSEGNAHQAFWSSDHKLILGATEDFTTYRGRIGLSGDEELDAYLGGTAASAAFARSGQLGPDRHPAVYLGSACTAAASAPAGAVAVIERGTCTLDEKVGSARAAGYVAAVVFSGTGPGQCEAGAFLTVPRAEIPVFGVTRSTGLRILDVPGYEQAGCEAGASPALPAPGTAVAGITLRAAFDGWGHLNLLDGKTLATLAGYAVPESLDETFASGFGTLSAHEVKTDPRRGVNLGYVAYYAAGARVVSFTRAGIRDVGRFIDEGGNSFWGTFPVSQGTRPPLWLLSDMDYGLYILRYTGPTRSG